MAVGTLFKLIASINCKCDVTTAEFIAVVFSVKNVNHDYLSDIEGEHPKGVVVEIDWQCFYKS